MRNRKDTSLVHGSALFSLLITIVWLPGCTPKPSVEIDFAIAMKHLRAIKVAESNFYATRGRYAKLDELWGNSPESSSRAIAAGKLDDFRFEVQLKNLGYAISIWPASDRRIVSLYSDQGGTVRIALRGARATQSSEVVRDHLD